MRQITTSTLSNQSLVTALLCHTYTADADRLLFVRVFGDQLAGNGDYVAYLTVQRLGAGSAYRVVPITTAAVASGVTSVMLTTIGVPVKSTDVVKVYLTGLAGDTTTPDIITEIWEDDGLRPTTADRTLDVSATGEAGLDFDNIKAASAPTVLANITVPAVTTLTTYTGNTPQTGDSFARLGVAGAGLTAVGDARLANLDAAVSTRATPAQVNTEADTALADAGVTSARMAYLTGPVATAAKLLSYFQSALRKDVTVDTDIGGTYDNATDSLEALSESLAGATVYATGSTPNTTAALYIRRGDTVAVTIGDLTGLAAGWDVLWVTIKKSVADDDSEAILQVRLNTATPALPGLIYINGQTPTDAGCAATDAWISDVDAGADTLVLNIKPAASLLLPAMGSLWFDVQQLDGTTITSLATGERSAEIGGDVTRATS